MDVDVIMSWPLCKIYEYMAFYLTESEEFKEQIREDNMTTEQKANQVLRLLGGK